MLPSAADDRRRTERVTFPNVFVNKFIDGTPHAARLVDVSTEGICLSRLLEPESDVESFALELQIGDVRLWAWVRRIWKDGSREALRFVGTDPREHARLKRLLRTRVAGVATA